MLPINLKMTKYSFVLFAFLLFACGEDTLPKPTSQLALEYPEPVYEKFDASKAVDFLYNDNSTIKKIGENAFELHYPNMKATLYLSYKTVNNDIDKLLRDAQKLTYDHVKKADDITEQPYINPKDNVYGMFYDLGGNAATNTQFYVTDSTNHFLLGSVYFYAKPNYDSIYPAIEYVKEDVRNLMSTVKWK